MQELSDFYNAGFGWICRRCERDLESDAKINTRHSRLLSEGEAESKQPQMSNHALAKWADKTHRILYCPRCGITELADQS
jgi:hypothetical protein